MRSSLLLVGALAGCAHTPAPPPARFDVGYLHHCALDAAGLARCEGDDRHQQLQAPQERFQTVSDGLYHSCGLTPEGRALCWGSVPTEGMATEALPDAPDQRFVAISAGDEGTCGLRADGALSCWGSAAFVEDPPAGPFVAVSAGGEHACALRAKGEVVCWGAEAREAIPCEQMDDRPESGGCAPQEEVPRGWTPPPPGLRAVAVRAGAAHTCALTRRGAVTCWGSDGWGDGGSVWAGQTRVPPDMGRAADVSAGGGHSCALLASGEVRCWGEVPSPAGRFSAIASGHHYACGQRLDGSRVCSARLVAEGGIVWFPEEPGWVAEEAISAPTP